MRNYLQTIVISLFSILYFGTAHATNILLLNSYQRGLNWSDEILRGVKHVTDQYENVVLFAEYMDTKRFSSIDYLDGLMDLYTQKYKGIDIDAVICADNPALDFVIKYAHNPLFKGYKVFCGVINVEDYQFLGNEYKGVAEREFFMERFQAIKKIVPNAQTVYCLMDKSPLGIIFRKRFEKVAQNHPSNLTLKIKDDIDINELYAFVSSLKDKNAVIDYISITKDRFGDNVNNEYVAAKVVKLASVPVFSNFDYLIGKGIIGGVYQLGSDQGTTAANIAMKLISGTKSADIPNVSYAPMSLMVDCRAIKHFNLPMPAMPAETIFLNQPQKIYVKYQSEFIIALSFIVILIGIILLLLFNIRKRRLSEQKLTQSEQKFKDMAELLPQTVYESDLRGNLTFVNKQAYTMFGYTEADLKKGINIKQLFVPQENEHITANLAGILEGKSNNPFFMALRKDGTTFPFEVHSSMFYKEGKPAGLRGIGIDITKQKEVEQELINAREKAEQSDKLKSAFLSNMSHEIRTPLNAIIGFSSLLSDAETSEDQRKEYKKYIQTSSEYLLNLISDIIDHSRIEAGQLEIIQTEFNLYEVMKELYLNFKSQQRNKAREHIQFVYENLDQTEQIIAVADPVRIKQIIGNLLDNAFKFTDNGSIRFGYTIQNGNHLLLTVKDTGTGISEEDKRLVFKRFYKLCSDNDKLYGGSGLGLSICKNLVSLMKGNIWLESKKGEGSTFFVNLPIQIKRYKQALVNSQYDSYPSVFNWDDKAILIAEDELSNFELVKAFLKNTGCEIIHAKNGKESIDLLQKNHVDLILMDIQMPVMNGYDAIRLIRKQWPAIPIIAQTAYAMAGEKEEILKSGSNAYLSKPIDKIVLLETIRQLMDEGEISGFDTQG